MKITDIQTIHIKIPLKKPFITALRTVQEAETIYVKITLENGIIGYGEAPPTHVITGDSLASIKYCIEQIFKPILLGQSITQMNSLLASIHRAIIRNTSAKAAIDMALFDAIAQLAHLPLYQFLGGFKDSLETDYTVSVNSPNGMANDAQSLIQDGFNILKIKVGLDDIETDLKRILAIREQVGDQPTIRLDANQGWSVKDAIYAINKMDDMGLNIELVEQPVKAEDIAGLKQVTHHTSTLIMADESVFNLQDAKHVLETRSCDLINIKLMKTGGIYYATKINQLAEAYGIPCMVGSMIETKLGITAAAHFAASQENVTRYDFDAPLMLSEDSIDGGIKYEQSYIKFSEYAGLGIKGLQPIDKKA